MCCSWVEVEVEVGVDEGVVWRGDGWAWSKLRSCRSCLERGQCAGSTPEAPSASLTRAMQQGSGGRQRFLDRCAPVTKGVEVAVLREKF